MLAFEAVTKDGSKLKEFPACIDNLVVAMEAVFNKPASFADAGPTAGRRPHDAVAFFAEMAESRFSFPLLRS